MICREITGAFHTVCEDPDNIPVRLALWNVVKLLLEDDTIRRNSDILQQGAGWCSDLVFAVPYGPWFRLTANVHEVRASD